MLLQVCSSRRDEPLSRTHHFECSCGPGRAKYTQALPGGVAAANEHFENAVELGSEVAEMILKASEIQEKAKSQNVDIGWLFGATGRGNFTPIQEYGQLPPGTVVKVLADRDRLRHFCEDEPPPGFSEVGNASDACAYISLVPFHVAFRFSVCLLLHVFVSVNTQCSSYAHPVLYPGR